MKSDEEYWQEFIEKKHELEQKNELWRLRVTQEEFLSEIQRLRTYEIDSKKGSTLNEYHIQRNIEECISVMLMDSCSFEEMKEQAKRVNAYREEYFEESDPLALERLKQIKTPLRFRESAIIYRWICRKQITMDMLSPELKAEFEKTNHFKLL